MGRQAEEIDVHLRVLVVGDDVAEGVIVAQRTPIGVLAVPVLLIVLKVHRKAKGSGRI